MRVFKASSICAAVSRAGTPHQHALRVPAYAAQTELQEPIECTYLELLENFCIRKYSLTKLSNRKNSLICNISNTETRLCLANASLFIRQLMQPKLFSCHDKQLISWLTKDDLIVCAGFFCFFFSQMPLRACSAQLHLTGTWPLS